MWQFAMILVLFLPGFCLAASQSLFRYPNVPPDTNSCQCVPPQDCINGTELLSQYAPSAERYRLQCENREELCCALASIINHERRVTTQENTSVPTKCGLRNPEGLDPNDIIERNTEAKFGEFPWMVALLKVWEPEVQGTVMLTFICGGSLIHPKAVITAAHCLVKPYNANRIIIRAGEWDTRNENEYLPHHERVAQKIIVHEDYNESGMFDNDYAIIIPETPFELTPYIGLACLPDETTNFNASRCVSTGWGQKVFAEAFYEEKILKKVELPMFRHDACVNMYHEVGYANLSLHASYLCAGGEYGKDVCNLDSGGPLVCPMLDEPTRYVQVGIVAAGIKECGTEGIPGVYSDVAFGRDWILRHLADNGLYIDN